MSFRSDYDRPQAPAAAYRISSAQFVTYCCGSCGYALNLSSSDRDTANIGSKYRKSTKKGIVSFVSVDESRFSLVEELRCGPYFQSRQSWGLLRRRTKLFCRKCRNLVGVGYEDGASSPVGPDHSNSGSGNGEVAWKKYDIKISALQPSSSDESATNIKQKKEEGGLDPSRSPKLNHQNSEKSCSSTQKLHQSKIATLANIMLPPDVLHFKFPAAEVSVESVAGLEGPSAIGLGFFFFDSAGANAGAAAGAGVPKSSKGRSTLSTWYTASWLSEYMVLAIVVSTTPVDMFTWFPVVDTFNGYRPLLASPACVLTGLLTVAN